MHVCDVSSKDVFNWSSVEVNQSLSPKEEPFLCFFLTRMLMCDDHDRFSLMLISSNLKLFTCWTSAHLMQVCVAFF